MKLNQFILASFFSALISGCASSLIDVKEGSSNVNVSTANKVTNCESKGAVTTSVLSKVWFVNRSVETIEENLLQMAKNAAIESGANTLVKGESQKIGERSFSLYHCR